MNRYLHLLILLSIGAVFPLTVRGQQLPATFEVPLPGITGYDAAIPTPMEVLGHAIGERHTTPHQLVDYFEAVAERSDRVLLRRHGATYENRPLVHAIVTSPENHARLDAIREAHLQLSQAPETVTDAMLDAMPAVILQGYSIHGNEASGSDAAVLYLYHLAAGNGPGLDSLLAHTVLIVDPSFNPDGRDRFTNWVNRNRGTVATDDGQDREHNEPWPGGRTNHYWFDLNRDWLPAQHPESQGRLGVFYAWRPLILTDHHEMGGSSTFFFQPGIPSRNNPNTLPRTFELTADIATFHARRLDAIGSLYYARESFDDFYYGKGSTYPDINGTIGILFEQASSRALLSATQNGNLPYATTVANQFVTSLSTADAALALRRDLLAHHRDFYASVPAFAQATPVKGYVVDIATRPSRALELARVLSRHQIAFHGLASEVSADGRVFRPGEAFVVPVNQMQGRLVKAVMERSTAFADSIFYDVSTWTLPLAFGVDYAELRQDPARLLGDRLEADQLWDGRRIGGRSSYGYLIPWGRYHAPRALYRLHEAGLYPRVLHRPITARVGGEAVSLPRGTLFVPAVSRDPARRVAAETLDALIDTIVEEDMLDVYALDSGLAVDGPDLGTPSADVLVKPRVALLTGDGASSYGAGEVWHLLSERVRMPVSLLDVDRVGSADLSRYTTIVMAGGGYNGLPAQTIETWVRQGGTLIALTSAASWAVRNELVALDQRDFDMDSLLTDRAYDEIGETRGAQVIGGSILEVALDLTHPLAYGHGPTEAVFRQGNSFYDPSERPGANVGVYSATGLLSGYISEEKAADLPGASAIVAESLGRGDVVLFMDNPNFRAFWYGSNGLFLNAIFLQGAY